MNQNNAILDFLFALLGGDQGLNLMGNWMGRHLIPHSTGQKAAQQAAATGAGRDQIPGGVAPAPSLKDAFVTGCKRGWGSPDAVDNLDYTMQVAMNTLHFTPDESAFVASRRDQLRDEVIEALKSNPDPSGQDLTNVMVQQMEKFRLMREGCLYLESNGMDPLLEKFKDDQSFVDRFWVNTGLVEEYSAYKHAKDKEPALLAEAEKNLREKAGRVARCEVEPPKASGKQSKTRSANVRK